jgi:hypothetical protein
MEKKDNKKEDTETELFCFIFYFFLEIAQY